MADTLLTVNVEVTGLLAELRRKRVPIMALKTAIKAAHAEVWRQWVNAPRGASYGLPLRFSNRAFSLLRFTPREPRYAAQVRRKYGSDLPFTSPNNGSHLRDEMAAAGGWTPRSKGTSEIRTRLLFPGARKINQYKAGAWNIYKLELMDLSRGAGDRLFLTNATTIEVGKAVEQVIRSLDGSKAKVA